MISLQQGQRKKNFQLRATILLLIVLGTYSTNSAEVESILLKDLSKPKGGINGELELHRNVNLMAGTDVPLMIEVTSKGNGVLRISNLSLKIFDSHDDGLYYENGLLKTDFVDLDGDGRREIVISGIVCFTGENDSMPTRREGVVFIYSLDAQGHFKRTYKNTQFSLE